MATNFQLVLLIPMDTFLPTLQNGKNVELQTNFLAGTVNNVSNVTGAPDSLKTIDATNESQMKFVMQVNPHDCTGCGVCTSVCPKKGLAIQMVDAVDIKEQLKDNYKFIESKPLVKSKIFGDNTVKGSQFNKPYFEFSGACAGCGETPYIKVLSQLFGDRMVVANATGCSSIYGGSAPTCAYSKNEKGFGPAWANSLFEDNAEFGFGINLAYDYRRNELKDLIAKLADEFAEYPEGKQACQDWLENMEDAEGSKKASAALLKCIEACKDCGCSADATCKAIYDRKDCLVKKSVWIFGGD